MSIEHYVLPDPGEGLTEAEIVSWKVAVGDEVKVNDVVVEVETAKSLVELPIPFAGRVAQILVSEGDEVEVGAPIIAIETDADAPLGGGEAPAAPAAEPAPAAPAAEPAAAAPAAGAAEGGVEQYVLPDPGEGLTEAEIVSWKVAVGDEVKVNDVVVEVETAKSLVELPIPFAGTVTEIMAAEGEEVAVGTPIIAVRTGAPAAAGGASRAPEAPAASSEAPAEAAAEDDGDRVSNLVGYGALAGSTTRRRRKGASAPAGAPSAPAAAVPAQLHAEVGHAASGGERPKAKPPVRKFAKDNGIDLRTVAPTGPNGIITRQDVEQALAGGGSAAAGAAPAAAAAPVAAAAERPAPQAPAVQPGERETRTPIKGVRKITAQAMVNSAFTAPHVTEFMTVDVSATMELVERLKKDRAFKDVKVTPLLLVAKAVVLAAKRNPEINAKWDEANQEIVQYADVNLGIAAATPRGLIVPNIKGAQDKSLAELGTDLGDLVSTARSGKTPPADMSGGTITITNVGVFGVDSGTPILNAGEAAILCFGAINRRPWVVTDAEGNETIEPRWVTELALSFDHRLVNGDLGSRYLADVAALLNDPGAAFTW
ncbi:pyruvate dehydrogenase E2 component (dihydrolipoamide acetyltransferase) [Kytococcus aerolatus]|uniref:Dihydrolipoamide acetyltransferase component of pyruvate dehydrogenase complex n=1 Tax=Kytococcus aerolatus TaxID=592308 RepID=A0A212TE12_9MICO|nr:2-oxo acid dehydrogenase subunit E2 [Kytococcus aerolatus]SNC64298.1 pyruvate dehydrogenase E2 component (dihydrolipoamide acetyltransferase) [Kytococcus aerolatus]